MAEFKLQFIERLRLDLVIGVALQIPSPFTLILYYNIFRCIHTGDRNAFSDFGTEISIFPQPV